MFAARTKHEKCKLSSLVEQFQIAVGRRKRKMRSSNWRELQNTNSLSIHDMLLDIDAHEKKMRELSSLAHSEGGKNNLLQKVQTNDKHSFPLEEQMNHKHISLLECSNSPEENSCEMRVDSSYESSSKLSQTLQNQDLLCSSAPKRLSFLSIAMEQSEKLSISAEEEGNNRGLEKTEKNAHQTQQTVYQLLEQKREDECHQLLEAEFKQQQVENVDILFIDPSTQGTLLHKAAKNCCLKIMELLVERGADIESKDSLHATPLFYAASSGSTLACEFLLERGATANIRDVYDNSPLTVALKRNFLETATMLLLHHADVNFKAQQGNTPLMSVVNEGNLGKVNFLLEHNASLTRTNRFGQSCFFYAVKDPAILKALLGEMKKTGDKGSLLKMCVRQDDRGQTLLHHCLEKGHLVAYLRLLQEILQDDISGKIAASLVLEREGIQGNTMLQAAVKYANSDIVKMLSLSTEVDVNLTNNSGDTALHIALQCKVVNHRIIRMLLCAGANTHLKNHSKLTCIQLAKQKDISLKECLRAPTPTSPSTRQSITLSSKPMFEEQNSQHSQKTLWNRLSIGFKKHFVTSSSSEQPTTATITAAATTNPFGSDIAQSKRHSMAIGKVSGHFFSNSLAPQHNVAYAKLKTALDAKRKRAN